MRRFTPGFFAACIRLQRIATARFPAAARTESSRRPTPKEPSMPPDFSGCFRQKPFITAMCWSSIAKARRILPRMPIPARMPPVLPHAPKRRDAEDSALNAALSAETSSPAAIRPNPIRPMRVALRLVCISMNRIGRFGQSFRMSRMDRKPRTRSIPIVSKLP